MEMEKRILQLECDLTQARKKFGRNNTSKRTWNAGDVTNMVNLNSWLRMKLFRVYKFLPSTWSTYSPDKPLSMCAKVLTKVRLPPGVGQESYWETRLVPLINKKYVEMRSNINSACRLAYQGEFPTNMTCCIYTVASHPIFGFVCLFTDTGEEVLSQQPSAIGLSAGPLAFIEYDPDNPNYGEPIVNLCTFIAKYVMKIYGVKMINDWLKKNKGQSFLTMMSMCDVAYCIALVQNSHEVWNQDKEVKKMTPNEQEKYRSWKTLADLGEREQYRMKEPKFSGGKEKRGYSVV